MMADALSVDIPIPEDILLQLLIASSSPSLKEALEILIQSSRTAPGRFDLASKNIISTVLQLSQSLLDTFARPYLLLSLKLLRNLCAGEISNQDLLIEQDGLNVVLMVLRSAGLDSNPDCEIIRLALQVLANVSLAGENHQRAIWSQFFPDEFLKLATVRSQETCDPLCMVIYSCCDGIPGLLRELCGDLGLAIVAEILRTTSSGFFDSFGFILLGIFYLYIVKSHVDVRM